MTIRTPLQPHDCASPSFPVARAFSRTPHCAPLFACLHASRDSPPGLEPFRDRSSKSPARGVRRRRGPLLVCRACYNKATRKAVRVSIPHYLHCSLPHAFFRAYRDIHPPPSPVLRLRCGRQRFPGAKFLPPSGRALRVAVSLPWCSWPQYCWRVIYLQRKSNEDDCSIRVGRDPNKRLRYILHVREGFHSYKKSCQNSKGNASGSSTILPLKAVMPLLNSSLWMSMWIMVCK